MKRLVPILLAVVLLPCMVFADGEDAQKYVLCKPGDVVNVRSKPSTRSTKEGYLECGDKVETDGKTKRDSLGRKWTHLTSPSFECQDVWVCSMYLQDTPVSMEKCKGVIVANGRTAVRRSPGGQRTKWLRNGDEVSILAMSNEWALTKQGYIRRDLLDVFYEQ